MKTQTLCGSSLKAKLQHTSLAKIFLTVAGLFPLSLASSLFAQSNDPFKIEKILENQVASKLPVFKSIHSNTIKTDSATASVYIHAKSLKEIQHSYHELISIDLPDLNGKTHSFYFTEYNFYSPDFELNLIENGSTKSAQNIDRGIHLKGIQSNHPESFASFSIFQNSLYGTAYNSNGLKLSFTPIQQSNTETLECLITDENQIDYSRFLLHCQTDDYRDYIGTDVKISSRLNDNCKILAISIDVDYALFTKFKGDIQAISNYITGLFNNIHTLYKRESISISLSQINIHTTNDSFSHTSASEDLERFRTRYPNTKRTVKLLLSGYEKNKIAPLGGIAYINTLCTPSYSYAFINVNGTYLDAPLYSWDVFSITHELGHIMGSRHTHACVWGPKKNIALDNCAKVEGSCGNPGIPAKGTIMSYCFQSGMPGIDLNLGFGTEPGNLIRQKVASSSCLVSYTPGTKTLSKENTRLEANVECFDGIYTHYYFDNNTIDPLDDILILSINKKSNDIGTLKDGSLKIALITNKDYSNYKLTSITAAYVEPKTSWNVLNKYVTIESTKKPITPINIVYYYSKLDIKAFQDNGLISTPAELSMYQLNSSCNPAPETNHSGATKESINYYVSASKSAGGFNYYAIDTNTYSFEVSSPNLMNSGLGVRNNIITAVQFSELLYSYAKGIQNISFTVRNETNIKHYRIEKSYDQIHFDSIGYTPAKLPSTTSNTYLNSQLKAEEKNLTYRIKAVTKNGQWTYSPLFTAASSYKTGSSLAVYPNPVKSGILYAEYQNTSISQDVTISISDIYGRVLEVFKQQAAAGQNTLIVNTSRLAEGLHYLSISNKTGTAKISFSVSK